MEDKIKIIWHCGYFVGQSYWQNTEIYEPDECNTSFETEDLLQNWNEGVCNAICPNCKGELIQIYDTCTLIDENRN